MANRFWVGGTDTWNTVAGSKWSAASGGAGGAASPTSNDDVFFDVNSTGTVTVAAGAKCFDLDCTGFAGTMVFSGSTSLSVGDTTNGGGNITMDAGMTLTPNNGTFQCNSHGSYTLTANGHQMPGINSVNTGATVNFADDYLTHGQLTLDGASVNTNNHNLTASSTISFGGTATRTLNFGSSTIKSTSNGVSFSATNVTLNPGTSLLQLVASGQTFAGAGLTFNDVTLAEGDTISGSNTINTLTITQQGTVPFKFTKATTQTVNSFNATGSAGNLISITSTLAANPATISCANAVNCDYLSLKDSTATGGGTFHAGANSTDVSGNSGWLFP